MIPQREARVLLVLFLIVFTFLAVSCRTVDCGQIEMAADTVNQICSEYLGDDIYRGCYIIPVSVAICRQGDYFACAHECRHKAGWRH